MKHIMLTGALLAAMGCAHAQTTSDEPYYGESNKEKLVYKAPMTDNEYANTEMVYQHKTVSFTDLPTLPRPTWAIITDGAGQQIKQMRVTSEKDELDTHRLQQGTYFVTLVYRNKSKKAFVLQVGR